MSEQAPQHDQIEAIILSASAIVMMSHHLHIAWSGSALCQSRNDPDVKEVRDHAAEKLLAACKAVDVAMQTIGDICNGCDCVDDREYTDKAFEALDRVFKRHDFASK